MPLNIPFSYHILESFKNQYGPAFMFMCLCGCFLNILFMYVALRIRKKVNFGHDFCVYFILIFLSLFHSPPSTNPPHRLCVCCPLSQSSISCHSHSPAIYTRNVCHHRVLGIFTLFYARWPMPMLPPTRRNQKGTECERFEQGLWFDKNKNCNFPLSRFHPKVRNHPHHHTHMYLFLLLFSSENPFIPSLTDHHRRRRRCRFGWTENENKIEGGVVSLPLLLLH
jgi:hypothetical protein